MRNLIYVHLSFMTVAAILIVTAAMIARGRKEGWFKRHRILAVCGVCSAFAAFAAIAALKVTAGYPHFKSPHSIAGAVTLILLVVTPVTGMLIGKGGKSLRPVHKILGKITSVVVVLTAISGYYRFFKR
jgi:hypothetical protein